MVRNLIRVAVAAVVVAAAAVAGSGLPARAVPITEENIITFYSTAQKTTIVGEFYQGGCPPGPDWGTFSAYSTLVTRSCS